MAYPITVTLLDKYNRPRTPLTPQGIVVHETAGHNDTDEGNFSYFNGANRSASAHYFVDSDSISQFIPDSEQAWHACYNGNIRYLGMELCHVDGDPAKFAEIWKRGVWLVAMKCIQYGWTPTNQMQVMSHKMVTDRWHESSHQDTDAYFTSYGKTFADFVSDVQAEIETIKNPPVIHASVGLVEVVCTAPLHVRVQPSTTAALARADIHHGERYKYYGKQNGWYNLGCGWAYGANGQYLQEV